MEKAGLTVCLFLFIFFRAITTFGQQQWAFDPASKKAYELTLDLELPKAHEMFPSPESPQETYVISLAETLELLLEEDGEKYTDYQANFEKRKDRKTKLNSPDDLFLQAEIATQWAFVYFKFGHEFDAALNLREAYVVATQLKRRFPRYEAVNKTLALLEIIIGSVPEKYNWVLGLLNIEGSVDDGLKLFESLELTNSPFKVEAEMLHALALGYVLQQPQKGVAMIHSIIAENSSAGLAPFIGGSLAMKSGDAGQALILLNRLEEKQPHFRINYAEYLRGEIFLCKGEYLNSITAYRSFINQYKGQNNIKDAYYKIGLCYWLNGNVNDAHSLFKQARNIGKEVTEADKYAARSMSDNELPHPKLTKARYFTDGGYYNKAEAILDSVAPAELLTKRDQLEYTYRRGRLAHKTGKLARAKAFYKEVIDGNGDSPWYFAPNASLQMGYLLYEEGNKADAEEYFEMALSYKKHEYKNSIDTKARSALAQLGRK